MCVCVCVWWTLDPALLSSPLSSHTFQESQERQSPQMTLQIQSLAFHPPLTAPWQGTGHTFRCAEKHGAPIHANMDTWRDKRVQTEWGVQTPITSSFITLTFSWIAPYEELLHTFWTRAILLINMCLTGWHGYLVTQESVHMMRERDCGGMGCVS